MATHIRTSRSELPTTPSQLMEFLDRHLDNVMAHLESTQAWKAATSAETERGLLARIVREIYVEIASYQPDVIEATIAVIGQMPRNVRPKLIQSMLIHQADEFDHGEMAIRDYVRLGGDETTLRNGRMSPTAHAVAAFWTFLAHKRDPFAYLGALYMFEGLTPRTSQQLLDNLARVGFNMSATEFAEFHATEDIKHQNLVKHLLETVAAEHPESIPSMLHGIETFSHVFPVPIVEAAYVRALALE